MNHYEWKGVGRNEDDTPKEPVSRRRVRWPTRSVPTMQGGMALEWSLFLPGVFRNGARRIGTSIMACITSELSTSQMNTLKKVLTCP
jgi:hypothetical protein